MLNITPSDRGSAIQYILLLIACPLGVLLDLATGFSVTREHPIFSLMYYGVTICEIFTIISERTINNREKAEKNNKKN